MDFEAAYRAAKHTAAVLTYVQQRGATSVAAALHGARHAHGRSNHQTAVPQYMNQLLHVPTELGMVQVNCHTPF